MPLRNIQIVLAALYLAVVAGAGLAGGVSSAAGWVALAALGLLPGVAMLTLWNHPSQTLSEAIVAARR